jgi:hypothetical protein
MTASVFGPVVNALVALGLFAVMLVVLRSRRPHLRRRDPETAPAEVEPAVGDPEQRVCGDTTTGR